MNLNNYTLKAQEAMQNAVQIVQQNGQQSIENAHILKGIRQSDENLVQFVLNKHGVKLPVIDQILESIIESSLKRLKK